MLSIGTRLGISYGVLGTLCVATGVVSYQQTQVVRQKMEDVMLVREPVNSAVHAMQTILTESAFATLGYHTTGDSSLLATLRANLTHLALARGTIRDAWHADDSVAGTLDREVIQTLTRADELSMLRDLQREALHTLLRDLDAMDDLLTQRIQTSVTMNDPVAFRRIQSVLEMKAAVNAMTRSVGAFLATGEIAFEGRFRQAWAEFEQYQKIYQAVLLSSDEKRWAAELRQRSGACIPIAERVISLEKDRRARLAEFLSACRLLGTRLDEQIIRRAEQSLAEGRADLLEAGARAKASTLAALLLSLVFGLGAGYLTTRNITIPLRQLASVMLAIARGDRAGKVSGGTTDEVRTLSDAFELMTSRLMKANAELREAQQERLTTLRKFAQSVQRAQEEERARISRELHDDLCQRLSGMKFRTEVVEEEIPLAHRRAHLRIRELTEELDRTITEVRRISSNLRPSALDDFGLVIALRMLCKEFGALHALPTQFAEGEMPAERIDPSIEIALYRIAQEALSNVAAHANASSVAMDLSCDGTRLRLVISDDGKGFDPAGSTPSRLPGRGFGLVSMRERTELLGGTFDVASIPGRGTTITSTLPLGEAASHEEDQDPHRG